MRVDVPDLQRRNEYTLVIGAAAVRGCVLDIQEEIDKRTGRAIQQSPTQLDIGQAGGVKFQPVCVTACCGR